MTRRTPLILAACSLLFLSACGKKTTDPNVTVNGATQAVPVVVDVSEFSKNYIRPSPLLGLFTSVYLSQSGFTPAYAALAGVEAQLKINVRQSPANDDETYTFLQEFGSILQVDVPDILNRSDERPTTLNEYVEGLTNITARAKLKVETIKATKDRLTQEAKDAQNEVNAHQKLITEADKNGDYETIGSEQQLLGEAKLVLTRIQAEQRQTDDVLRIFQRLIDVADKRLAAINENREILIAGLSVVELPGIEDLRLIEQSSSRGGSGVFGGLGGF